MPDNTIRPPDMVGAGLTQQPQDPASLIGLLRSQGSLPAEAMAMMAPPMPSGGGPASALLGGVAMMPGQTGAQQAVGLNQQNAQFQQHQQMQQAQMMERIQARKQAQMERQQKAYLDMADTLTKSGDKNTRTYGWKMRVQAAKQMGVELPESIAEASATERLSAKDHSDILVRMGMGYTDEALTGLYPDATARDLGGLRTLAKDPKALRAAGFDPNQLKRDELDLRVKEWQAIGPGDAKVAQLASITAQKKYGRSYLDLNPAQQAEVSEAARNQVKAEEERKIRLQSQLSLDKALVLAQIRADVQTKKPLTPLQKQKLLEGPKRARDTLAAMDRLEEQIDAMDNLGVLPKGEDYASQMLAKVKRETLLHGNPAVFQFKQAWAPISVGQIDRGLFDEKNVRFKQAFEQQTGVMDNMPPAAAMKAYLATMRGLIKSRATSDVADWEDLGYPDDVIEVSKRMLGVGKPQTLPRGPLTPPADLTYDPKTKAWGKPNAPR